ncbi:MAG: hypothetical protein HYU48_02655 [Candidatus Levybacteria bacterium]|nr:hypothetical protein [Candidatus Levybacteria bacterium]
MSKKTIALIISLFAVTVVLIILALYPVAQKTSISIPAAPTKGIASTVLSFSTPTISTASAVSTGSATIYSMDTTILTGSNRVNAVQLELYYDPDALANVELSPGNFFTNPVVLLKNVDTKQGRISYALAASAGQSGKQGKGVVAVLSFRSLLPAGESTTIKFLPKTQVAAEGVQASVLKSTTDITIFGGTSSATLSQ